jgi:type IV pilus assembly protein PilM
LEGFIDNAFKRKDILGLDIGTTSVKFAQLKNSGSLTKLIGYGMLSVPDNIIIEGVISEPEALAKILLDTFKAPPWGKITAKRVIASLPESKVFNRILEFPSLSEKDLVEAVKFEVDQSIPIPASDLYVDWQIIGETKDKYEIFLSAAPRAIVDSYIQLFKSLDLEPLSLELSMAAIARSMVSNKNKREPVVILDLGGTSSNLAVVDETLRITESHPVGGKTVRDSLVNTLGLSEKKADDAIDAGIKTDSESAKVIKEELDKAISEISNIVSYYSERNPNSKISKVLICGGLGYMKGLTDYIKEKSGLDCQVGNPWVNISIYPLKPVPKNEASEYAAAVGLCLRGLEND